MATIMLSAVTEILKGSGKSEIQWVTNVYICCKYCHGEDLYSPCYSDAGKAERAGMPIPGVSLGTPDFTSASTCQVSNKVHFFSSESKQESLRCWLRRGIRLVAAVTDNPAAITAGQGTNAAGYSSAYYIGRNQDISDCIVTSSASVRPSANHSFPSSSVMLSSRSQTNYSFPNFSPMPIYCSI